MVFAVHRHAMLGASQRWQRGGRPQVVPLRCVDLGDAFPARFEVEETLGPLPSCLF